MKKICSFFVTLSLLIASAYVYAVPEACPSLSQVYAQNNMYLGDWYCTQNGFSNYEFSNGMRRLEGVNLKLSYVKADNKEAALKASYEILNHVSKYPILISKTQNRLECVYKTSEDYYLRLIYINFNLDRCDES